MGASPAWGGPRRWYNLWMAKTAEAAEKAGLAPHSLLSGAMGDNGRETLPEMQVDMGAKTIIGFAWRHRRYFRTGVGLAVARVLFLAPLPWLFKIIVDDHVKNANIRGIFEVCGIFVVLLIAHYFCSVAGARMVARSMSLLLMACMTLSRALFMKRARLSTCSPADGLPKPPSLGGPRGLSPLFLRLSDINST